MNDKIIIRGAREHNLRNIDLELPKDSLVVISGLSGSGKSSLAFDTIFAEGQRRYIESLSSYARMFLLSELSLKSTITTVSSGQGSGTSTARSAAERLQKCQSTKSSI